MKSLPYFLLLLLIAGCSSSDCTLSNRSYVYMLFYDEDNAAMTLTNTITVTAAGTDSILVNSESSATQLELPLSYTNETDTFVMQYTSIMLDSIFVRHTNIPHFLSMDCGLGMYYHLDSVWSTHNAIDSIKIINPDIDYDEAEHIKIWFMDGV